MVLSTQTHQTARHFSDAEAVSMIAKAGFDAVDFTMFDGYNEDNIFGSERVAYLKELKDIADSNGVYFNQAHAPFPSYRVEDDEYNKKIKPQLIMSVENAGILGVKNLIVHPVFLRDNKKQFNMELYNSLLPYAKDAGVKIALENMWGHDPKRNYIVANVCSGPDEMCDYYDSLDPDYFTVCLDIGHCGLVGEDEAEFIRKLGQRRLGALHVHDTDYKTDSHTLPYMRSLDWNSITGALREIDYKGDFTFEADNFLCNMPKELFGSSLKFMHDTGRFLISKIESKEV